ncbi:hypothetical protein AALP_AA8G477600 [Arabis alpina]|uniref:DUF1216 domain-containing protein n=1 Tax=Arabis alpina TaxID=50452 RepID=A0A087GE38_ARAAL|nr:hypothetical protein AALP_AA8G477600 [Arabis alpina]
MAKKSSAVYLLLLIALIIAYPTQGTDILTRLYGIFPRMSKDFVPYAHKGMLDFVGELEGKCPATVEFKDFCAKLKDYINSCFNPTSSGLVEIQVETSKKSKQLSKAMSSLNVTSAYYWTLVSSLVSMEKVVVEIKKSNSTEMPREQQGILYRHLVEWVANIVLFAREASKLKGKTIDVSTFAISALNGTKDGSLDSWELMDGLSSMGDILVEMKKSSLKEITFEERRELTWSMVKWAHGINLFVKTASKKKGVTIDISSFENYYNSNVLDLSKGVGDKTGRGHRNVGKGTSANNSSNSTKSK